VFDIGFLELFLIFVVALVVLGPERLPVAARTVGRFVGKIKRSISGVQAEIEQELRFEEIRRQAEARARQLEQEIAMESVEEHLISPHNMTTEQPASTSDRKHVDGGPSPTNSPTNNDK